MKTNPNLSAPRRAPAAGPAGRGARRDDAQGARDRGSEERSRRMEPEPEPELPQIKLHQFTEDWQGVRVHGLFALFTGQCLRLRKLDVADRQQRARKTCSPAHAEPAVAPSTTSGFHLTLLTTQAPCLCGLATTRGLCQTYPRPAATNTCACSQPNRALGTVHLDKRSNCSTRRHGCHSRRCRR